MLALKRTSAIVLMAVSITACSPDQVVNLFAAKGTPIDQLAAATISQKTNEQSDEVYRAIRNPVLACIRYHESDRNKDHGPLFTNGQTNENPHSSASGFYQWLDGSWRGNAASHGFPQWSHVRAKQAPAEVQHVVSLRVLEQGGKSNWKGATGPNGRSCFI